ncbi:MAG: restriction endonuclease subunit S [Dehalococcoidales bacterium]|nr:restriction endonuclease subunit S [Dehalococcoidales bacterium]
MDEWKCASLDEAVVINPPRRLRRGAESDYVPMEALEPGYREVVPVRRRMYTGSGATFTNGDTLLARITPCLENGKTAYVDRLSPGAVAHGSTEFIVLSGRQGITDSRFVYYLARDPAFREYAIKRMEGSSGRQRVPVSALANYQFLLPSLRGQLAISNLLGSLDDKIELNRRTNETLEAMARAIFKSWFVDFDPVRAKAAGRQPVGMDTETAALFPDSFEESELGDIPRGWKIARLDEVVQLNPASIGKDYPHPVIQYIDISSVTVGHLDGVTTYTISDSPSRAQRLVSPGDTIWSCVRPNRKSYLFIHEPAENVVVSTGFVVLSPRVLTPSYLYAWVTCDQFVDYLAANADGSAYPAVRPEHFAGAEVLVPSGSTLEAFETLAGPMRDRIAANDREAATLAEIRDALLPKLLSGEVRVHETERMVGNRT